ncbi:D-alanyl-D-alanine carboxypeptidase [Lentilactobacillus otakiensis]|uniref:Possible D-alanyl-D-alanine carboxypeptidase n=1 Tax=Lentilactobacillus otakiensis DSM 19908 = JCM 15040 TaxID=1423780 RepID=S4PNS7_9LACO|nr:hypothetical protein [Lentilactobacillus otakiensis]KRL08944.1 hypothetical protein FD05_GL001031 [Lentilactobacillus otakiensis DSM 19908 = JCM 15040]MBZ3775557.1 D-alanyl-D-alanine carboxypeptidase [Lentilactobacillus otakiensis]MDV3518777.1 D-alanyl-D-alanine carboxypeptidase [Lentilactobacillus otakiensis]GAD16065.1 possible D-alanyl-D-alanine carboxypeptidase [Lentilactobacillus otakiensis DSM 19908 = JCM 15040]
MKKVIQIIGIFIASLLFMLTAPSAPAQAAHNGYRIKVLKTYDSEASIANAYHAKPKTQAYVWSKYFGGSEDKNFNYKDFQKKLYKLSNYRSTTWFVQQKVRVYHHLKSGTYYYVTNFSRGRQGYVKASALQKGYSPYGYQILQKKYGTKNRGSFYIKNPSQNVYMWDWTHTKKRLNLKDYPGMTWSRAHIATVKHNGKISYYDYLGGYLRGNGKYISGYVYTGNLTEGTNPIHTGQNIVYPNDFLNSSNYLNYIQTGHYQKLAREIVKLFPNTPVDLGLSKIAAYNYASDDEGVLWYEDKNTVSTKGYTDIISLKLASNYLYKHKTASNAVKLAGVKSALDKTGYPASKRAALSGYKLGIYIVNNIPDKYGSIIQDGAYGHASVYALILGKTDDSSTNE